MMFKNLQHQKNFLALVDGSKVFLSNSHQECYEKLTKHEKNSNCHSKLKIETIMYLLQNNL